MSYQKQLLVSTKSKYFKFKSRLEKNINSGAFHSLSRKKKNGLLDKVEKFRARVERLSLPKRGVIAGSTLTAAIVPNFANAQAPNFYLQSKQDVTVSNAQDVVIANIDADPEMEVILATDFGGVIANSDGNGGYINSSPTSLSDALLFVMVADIDGDTDLDLIFGNESDNTYFYKSINDGTGAFTTSYIDGLSVSSDTDLVDWDADGDMDIVLSSFGSSFEVLENDGSGNFTNLGATDLTRPNVLDVEFADLDNDGDMDMLHVSYSGTVPYTGSVYAFENTTDGPGTPTFDLLSPSIVLQQNYTRFDGIVPLDFDGDGDLDLFYHRQNSGYGFASLNNFIEGAPFSFSDVEVTDLSSTGSISASAVADFDADGDDDLIVAGTNFNEFLRFDGAILNAYYGNLGGEIGNVYGDFHNIYVGDLDGDDNLDLIGVDPRTASADVYIDDSAPTIGEFYGSNILDENTPAGTLMGILEFGDLQDDPISATLVGDNAPFFHLDEATLELSINAELDWETQGSDLLFEVELSDGIKSRVEQGLFKVNNLAEEGNGTFSETPTRIFGMREFIAYEPGDYDMDGDTDLFTSSYDGAFQNSILQHNSGSFTDELVNSLDEYQRSAEFINGTGGLDLLVHDRTNDELRWMNQNGSGFNSYVTLLTGILEVENMIVGDFDGDQLVEAVVHASNSLNNELVYTFESDGNGFTLSQTLLINTPSLGPGLLDAVGEMDRMAIADFDGDGFHDLLAVTTNGDDVIFSGGLDLGGGAYGFESTFSTAVTQADGGESEVQVGDIDGDGSNDIAIIRWEDNVSYALRLDLHMNDGNGNFTLEQTMDLGGEYAVDMALVDIDGNGSLDLVTNELHLDNVGGELVFSMDLNTHINDGAGNFTLFQTIEEVGGEDFKMIDVDGDDDLDIVMRYGFSGNDDLENQLKVYENVNVAPTAINLSQSSFDEHLELDNQIATITVDDLNSGDMHVLSLATGDGVNDEHNSFFSINGNVLSVVKDVRFEDTPSLSILLSVYDGYNTFEQAFALTVNDVNLAPTGISLSSTDFDENTLPGSEIATISATDPNIPDDHIFELTVGNGINDADNGAFLIDGNKLYIVEESSFEAKAMYNIYLSVSDLDNSYEEAFVISVNDINQAPTGITLSASSFDEGTMPGSSIATLNAVDANPGDTHVFSLASGDGTNDADNGSFVVEGNNLRINEESNFETKETYRVHLSAADTEGSFQQSFIISVNDLNQAPTGITLSASSFDEGTAPGTLVATLIAVDANAGDTHTFRLTTGDGTNDADNASFVIDGSNLIVTSESRFETQAAYHIHLTVADDEGRFDQAVTISVNDINQAPTGINLSATSFDEGTAPGTVVANLSAIDANAGDIHTFSLSTGDGLNDADNASFVIDGSNLVVTSESSFETQPTYNIHLTVANDEGSFDQAVAISVNDINQAPTGILFSSTSFDEGTSVGSVVTSLSAIDANDGDTHTFELSVGDGSDDADNAAFIITGNSLIIVEESSFELKANYNIHLTVSDDQGSFSSGYSIGVNDINQAPSAIMLSNSLVDEGAPGGTIVATVSVTDPNEGDTHALELVAGDGTDDRDNDLFLINGDELILVGNVDFDATQSLNILLSANDGNQTFEQAFVLTVNEVLGFSDISNEIDVYPNPGSSQLGMKLSNHSRGQMTIEVLDLTGRVVKSVEMKKTSNNWSTEVDMTGEQPGVYVVEILLADRKFIRRWIKR